MQRRRPIVYAFRGALLFALLLVPLFLINEDNQFLFIPWGYLTVPLGVFWVQPMISSLLGYHPLAIPLTYGLYVIFGAGLGWLYAAFKNREKPFVR